MELCRRSAAVVVALAGIARADPPTCASLTNPVYIQCGDTQTNLMLNLGRALRDNVPYPVTLVWVTAPSCNNIDLMYHGGEIGDGGNGGSVTTMSYVPSTAEAATWTPAAGPVTCTLPVGGVVPDVGNSALFNSACTEETPPATVTLAQGPEQAYVLAVPRGASAANAIAVEQAYFLFGFGPMLLASMSAPIAPWIDQNQLFIRKTATSTLLAWAANIGIAPPTLFQGIQEAGSPEVVAALESSSNPGAAIGILGAEVYDAERDQLQDLAYRTYHQYAAYYPDSTATSRDKQNVRDGHYTVWSPTIWMSFVDASGAPVAPAARYAIDLIAGIDPTTDPDPTTAALPAPDFDPQVIVAGVGLVPSCAMRVTRSYEGGPLSLYTPPQGSCTCKYESTVDETTCATCTAQSDCGSGVCRDGYCEAF